MTLRQREVLLVVDDLEVSGLDFRFDIESHLGKEPNQGDISVWNLGPSNRDRLAQKDSVSVLLQTAYAFEENSFGTLFQGKLVKPESLRDGVDWVLKLQSDDGGKERRTKRIKKSYKGPVSLKTVWDDLVDAMGLSVGNAKKAFSEGRFKDGLQQAITGNVSHGQVIKLIEDMAKSMNLEVSIQNEELLVLKIGQARSDLSAVVLSQDTGLIGSPVYTSDGFKARSLILPQLQPGREVQLESYGKPKARGRIEVVRFSGSTFDNEWYADLECRRL